VNVLSTAREPVQGALIITLQGEDVVLPGDLALRKAVQAAYRLDHLPAQQEVLAIADKWWTYRGLATSYLSPTASTRPGYQTFLPPSTTRSTPVT
jgi:DNA-3-methyladenine glycosylase II